MRVRTVYPDNPCESYQQWVDEVIKGKSKMRTTEYLEMLKRDKAYSNTQNK